jgi:hypothetical protein
LNGDRKPLAVLQSRFPELDAMFSPDGGPEAGFPLTVVTNWQAGLKK